MSKDLTGEEFATLRQLSRSFAQGTVPSAISTRLEEAGCAVEPLGSLIITDRGSAKLQAGNA